MEHHLGGLIAHYGYAGILIALSLGIVGLPIPDETLLTYAGFAAYQGTLSLPLVILFSFCGSASGITVSYAIGYKLGLPFLKKFGPKIHITEEKITGTHRMFERYGNILLIIGYYIPGVRHLTAYVAAISQMDFRKFMVFAYTGAFIWTLTFVLLGYFLGERWVLVHQGIKRYGVYVLIALLLIAAGVWLYRQRKKAV
ncbi:DedA family protein [Brevibacillus fluminis]|uniref:DedA family protein n=1 Tax=Brevibacillus fluminis TaxID=511487 RepID=UPI003F8A4BB8